MSKNIFIKWTVDNNYLRILKIGLVEQLEQSNKIDYVDYGSELCSYTHSHTSPHNTQKHFTKFTTKTETNCIYLSEYTYGEECAYSIEKVYYLFDTKSDLLCAIKEIYIDDHQQYVYCELCDKNGEDKDTDKEISEKCINTFIEQIKKSKHEGFGGNHEICNIKWSCYKLKIEKIIS